MSSDLTKSKCCGSKLRVYQPDGQIYATIYCPKCESPWLVHCRDANGSDITDLLEWFEGDGE